MRERDKPESGADEADDQREREPHDTPLPDDDGPPLAELPLSLVVVDPRWNCRGPSTEEEIAAAFERFTKEPMLHPPSVSPLGDGRYQLVSGFLRFEVLRRQGWGKGWFRVVHGSELDLYLWNLAENTARRALQGHELVERVWMLTGRGVSKDRIAQACGFGVRYLNRLLFIRRRAHPELYALFRQGHPKLTIPRMARLAGHDVDKQMAEFKRSEGHLDLAVEIEQGFSDSFEAGEEPEAVEGYQAPRPKDARRRRRRLPPRAHVRRLLDHHRRDATLHPEYRRAAVAVLEHLLTGQPLPGGGDGGSAA